MRHRTNSRNRSTTNSGDACGDHAKHRGVLIQPLQVLEKVLQRAASVTQARRVQRDRLQRPLSQRCGTLVDDRVDHREPVTRQPLESRPHDPVRRVVQKRMELNLRIIKVVFNLLQAMTDPLKVALERGQIQVHLKVPRPSVLHRTAELLDRTHRLAEVVLQVLGRLSPVLAPVAQGDRAPLGLAHPLLVSLKHLMDSRLRPERRIANVLHRVLGLARRINRLLRQAISLLHDLVELGLNSTHPGRRRIRGSILLLL